jgi:hypothetical protein
MRLTLKEDPKDKHSRYTSSLSASEMRQVLLINNQQAFESERARAQRDLPLVARSALAQLPDHASVLVSDRKGWFGRLRSRVGLIMVAAHAVGTIEINAKDIRRGWIRGD